MSQSNRPVMEALFQRYDTFAMAHFRNTTPEVKADGSVVTEVDLGASKMVWDALLAHTPEVGIVSEEVGEDYLPQAAQRWIIDPVDGTASFSRGYPVWGLGIGLMDGETPREGYMRFPAINESYCYEMDEFFFNGVKLEFAQPEVEDDTRNLLIDSSIHRRVSQMQPFRPYKLREFGSTLYHLASLAMGRAEAMFCGRVSMWDMAAALPMTRKAGFIECHADGRSLDISAINASTRYKLPEPLVVARPAEMDAMLAMLAEATS